MSKWFDSLNFTTGNTTTTGAELGEKFRTWGQQTFAGNYSRGGIASYMFSPGGRRPGGLFGETKAGSSSHIRKLERMRESGRYDKGKIDKALERATAAGNKAKTPWKDLGGMSKAGRVGGMMLKAGPMALITGVASAAMTQGSAGDKLTAGLAMGIGTTVGWEVGSKAGMAAGAAIGSVVPVVGTAIGAVAGYIIGGLSGAYAGEQGIHGIKGMMDKRVELARKQKYASGWYGDMSAFNTQKAATMRQYSLQAMNQGMMSARSGLGHEGVMVHK